MKKYDRSLIEVWEWKERVYDDLKDLTSKEWVERIKQDADRILSDALIELTRVNSTPTFIIKE